MAMLHHGNMVFFHGKEDEFSNFYRSPITHRGVEFGSVEHMFQYYKAVRFEDKAAAEVIKRLKWKPYVVKQIAYTIEGFDKEAWEKVKESVMLSALRLKYRTYPDLGKLLRDTREDTIVEASATDKYWGIGLGKDREPTTLTDESAWVGKNRLGILLMQVREELNNARD